jgi:ankyrin repeat protein
MIARQRTIRNLTSTAALAGALVLLAGCERAGQSDPEAVKPVRANDGPALSALLASGVSPDSVGRNGDSLIYLAVGQRGGEAVLRVLIEAGADVEKGSGKGRTPLQNAAGWCSVRLVKILIEAGADPNRRGADGKLAIDGTCAQPRERRDQVLAILGQAMGRPVR